MNLSFPKIRKGSPKDVVTAYLGLIMKEKRRPRVSICGPRPLTFTIFRRKKDSVAAAVIIERDLLWPITCCYNL
jgi:hypothetical protein